MCKLISNIYAFHQLLGIIEFLKNTHIKTHCKIFTLLNLLLKTQLKIKYSTSKTHN